MHVLNRTFAAYLYKKANSGDARMTRSMIHRVIGNWLRPVSKRFQIRIFISVEVWVRLAKASHVSGLWVRLRFY